MCIRKFDPVIYPYKLWVMVGGTSSDVAEKFIYDDEMPIDPIKLKEETGYDAAYTLPVVGKETKEYGVLILFISRKYIDFGHVAHESSHAAKELFEHIGADINSTECFEYLVQWFAECCGEMKKPKKKENE